MSSRIGIVMDAIDGILPYKDTTLAIMLEFQRRGHSLEYMQPQDLYLAEGSIPSAITQPVKVNDTPRKWYALSDKQSIKLSAFDLILMRKDPPVDIDFITATQLLSLAEKEGVKVCNKPQTLRDCNEKLFASEFPQCQPPTLVSSRFELLREFRHRHSDIVLKPLHGMGGTSVFKVTEGDTNFNVILETLTKNGEQPIIAQRFVPEIKHGDKRILMIKGEPFPYALARLPADGEIRANLASGGKGIGVELSERDRWICAQVAPTLKEKNIVFAGIDVIGHFLTEINITSPTCVRELESIYKKNICAEIADAMLE